MVTGGWDTIQHARAEAVLYLEWARGAGGPWLPADGPAPQPPASPALRPDGRPAPLEPAAREAGLVGLVAAVGACRRCPLAATRTHTVPGEGSPTPRLVIVGEAPGAEEDRTGRPFVGAAGRLLERMLAAIGLGRDDVYITNLLKCRPPSNRNPRPEEVTACRPFLREQLALLQPSLVLALGSPAARELLRTTRGITSLRGRFARSPQGLRVLPTYHPAYLLRNPAAKRETWLDLQKVAAELGLAIPPRGKQVPE